MPATTRTAGGGDFQTVRRLSLGSDNFLTTGQPVFREYLKHGMPPVEEQQSRRFVQHPQTRDYYEIFTDVEGCLLNRPVEGNLPEFLQQRVRNIGGKQMLPALSSRVGIINGRERRFLIVTVDDGTETFEVELGDINGRYAINFMSRLCDPNLRISLPISIRPYRFTPKGEGLQKEKFGVAVVNPPSWERDRETDKANTLHPQKRSETFLLPDLVGKDFDPIAKFLAQYLFANVVPKISTVVLVADRPAQVPLPPPPQTGQSTQPTAPAPATATGQPGINTRVEPSSQYLDPFLPTQQSAADTQQPATNAQEVEVPPFYDDLPF